MYTKKVLRYTKMTKNIFDVKGFECKGCGYENPLREEGESLESARTCKKCEKQCGFYGVYR